MDKLVKGNIHELNTKECKVVMGGINQEHLFEYLAIDKQGIAFMPEIPDKPDWPKTGNQN